MQDTPLNIFKDKRYDYLEKIATDEELRAFKFWDYKSSEDFLIENAELTAEGILKFVIEELPLSLKATHAAITGYGRVGSKTEEILTKVGCRVTVFERNPEKRVRSNFFDFPSFMQLGDSFDCVINTVPELVLTDAMLRAIKPECVLIETASAPYGIDFDSADRLGLKTIIAGGLPGKMSPKTAAEIILKSIRNGKV